MKTWNEYKDEVKSAGSQSQEDIEIIEGVAKIVETMIAQRTAMGLSQRELATLCGMPQSSVARIESYKTTPNLDTLLKIFRQLGLQINISSM